MSFVLKCYKQFALFIHYFKCLNICPSYQHSTLQHKSWRTPSFEILKLTKLFFPFLNPRAVRAHVTSHIMHSYLCLIYQCHLQSASDFVIQVSYFLQIIIINICIVHYYYLSLFYFNFYAVTKHFRLSQMILCV